MPSDRAAAAYTPIAELAAVLANRSPETLIVMTARTQLRSVLPRQFVDGFGEVLTVAPFTPADLYALDELLHFRREGSDSPAVRVSRELLTVRLELLGRIAPDHLLESDDPANVLSLSRAERPAQEYWQMTGPDQRATDLTRLAVDTGIIQVQRRGESLQFMHLSLCEYLAGRELAECGEATLHAAPARAAPTPRTVGACGR